MPEKIADKVETNGHAMPDKAPEKIKETGSAAHSGRYTQEAETGMEDAFRRYNDLMDTTTEFYFDIFERSMRDTMDMTGRAERAMHDTLTIYRRTYSEGFKFWQTYWQDLNKIYVPPR